MVVFAGTTQLRPRAACAAVGAFRRCRPFETSHQRAIPEQQPGLLLAELQNVRSHAPGHGMLVPGTVGTTPAVRTVRKGTTGTVAWACRRSNLRMCGWRTRSTTGSRGECEYTHPYEEAREKLTRQVTSLRSMSSIASASRRAEFCDGDIPEVTDKQQCLWDIQYYADEPAYKLVNHKEPGSDEMGSPQCHGARYTCPSQERRCRRLCRTSLQRGAAQVHRRRRRHIVIAAAMLARAVAMP